MSVEIFSTAAQLFEKCHLEKLAIGLCDVDDLEGHFRSSELPPFDWTCVTAYDPEKSPSLYRGEKTGVGVMTP